MLGVNLGISSARTPKWWPQGAVYAADFVNNRFAGSGVPIPSITAFSLTRSSAKMASNVVGNWTEFASNIPAQNNKGISIENAETYYPTNSAFDGAVVGVVGAGGSLPTGWEASSWTEVEIVAIGPDIDGLPFIVLDLTLNNTAGGSTISRGVRVCDIADTAQGDFWTIGIHSERISTFGDDTVSVASNKLQIQERTAENGFLTNSGGVILGADAYGLDTRQTRTKEMLNANTGCVQYYYTWGDVQPGEYFHRRVALKMPTATKSQTVSSPIQTTNSGTVTRAADALTLHLPMGTHDLTVHYHDASWSTLADVSGDVSVPVTPEKSVTQIVANEV